MLLATNKITGVIENPCWVDTTLSLLYKLPEALGVFLLKFNRGMLPRDSLLRAWLNEVKVPGVRFLIDTQA